MRSGSASLLLAAILLVRINTRAAQVYGAGEGSGDQGDQHDDDGHGLLCRRCGSSVARSSVIMGNAPETAHLDHESHDPELGQGGKVLHFIGPNRQEIDEVVLASSVECA